jgi:homogentisate 1,2-dioxygenase
MWLVPIYQDIRSVISREKKILNCWKYSYRRLSKIKIWHYHILRKLITNKKTSFIELPKEKLYMKHVRYKNSSLCGSAFQNLRTNNKREWLNILGAYFKKTTADICHTQHFQITEKFTGTCNHFQSISQVT